MNERIQELIKQATVEVRGHGAFGEPERYTKLDPEKFAQLIVRECADFIKPLGDWRGGHGEPPMPSTSELAKRLKEHFGVEE